MGSGSGDVGIAVVHASRSESCISTKDLLQHHPPSHHIRMRPTYLHTAHTAQDTECKGVLIRDSDLSTCMTEIPTSPNPDPIQSPVSITIEFKTDMTKSGGWTLVARRARPRARQHKCYLAPASLATIAQPNRIAKLII